MIFHTQQHLVIRNGDGEFLQNGSCYPTVIACILNLQLDQVPYFHLLYWGVKDAKKNISKYLQNRYLNGKSIIDFDGEQYQRDNFTYAASRSLNLWDEVRTFWLASIGYEEAYIEDIDKFIQENPDVPYMVTGLSSRGVDHVVIYKAGQMIHDPHPSREGLVKIKENYAFTYLKKIE